MLLTDSSLNPHAAPFVPTGASPTPPPAPPLQARRRPLQTLSTAARTAAPARAAAPAAADEGGPADGSPGAMLADLPPELLAAVLRSMRLSDIGHLAYASRPLLGAVEAALQLRAQDGKGPRPFLDTSWTLRGHFLVHHLATCTQDGKDPLPRLPACEECWAPFSHLQADGTFSEPSPNLPRRRVEPRSPLQAAGTFSEASPSLPRRRAGRPSSSASTGSARRQWLPPATAIASLSARTRLDPSRNLLGTFLRVGDRHCLFVDSER